MADVFATVVEAIVSVTGMEAATITPEKHIFDDLQIDSLDFLDITFEIDRSFGIKLPVEEWVAGGKGPADEKFRMTNFVGFVTGVLESQASAPAS